MIAPTSSHAYRGNPSRADHQAEPSDIIAILEAIKDQATDRVKLQSPWVLAVVAVALVGALFWMDQRTMAPPDPVTSCLCAVAIKAGKSWVLLLHQICLLSLTDLTGCAARLKSPDIGCPEEISQNRFLGFVALVCPIAAAALRKWWLPRVLCKESRKWPGNSGLLLLNSRHDHQVLGGSQAPKA